MATRTHRKRIEEERAAKRLTAEQVRRAKCEKTKQRSATRKAKHMQEQEDRLNVWRSLSPKEQIAALRKRPGQCRKQIKRIKESMSQS